MRNCMHDIGNLSWRRRNDSCLEFRRTTLYPLNSLPWRGRLDVGRWWKFSLCLFGWQRSQSFRNWFGYNAADIPVRRNMFDIETVLGGADGSLMGIYNRIHCEKMGKRIELGGLRSLFFVLKNNEVHGFPLMTLGLVVSCSARICRIHRINIQYNATSL